MPAPDRQAGSVMQQIRARARAHRVPLHAMIEVTHRCNLRCAHCYLAGATPQDDLGLDAWLAILDQLAGAGCLFLNISGGEPLVRDDLSRLVAEARRRSFAVTLFTNGTLLTPRLADTLAANHLQRVEISLLGAGARSHDALTRSPGSFERACRAVALLRERGVNVQIKTTWMRPNIDEAESIARLVKSMGASFRGGFLLLPNLTHGPGHALDDLQPSPEQLRALARRHRTPHTPDPSRPRPRLTEDQKKALVPCGAGNTSCLVNAQGILQPCVALRKDIGDLTRRPFLSLWQQHPFLQNLRNLRLADLSECSSCSYLAVCRRCAGLALAETGSLRGPSPQACRLAQARADAYGAPPCNQM